MLEKKYTTEEAKKLVTDYIDRSAVRLSQRLKKAYSDPKKRTTKVRLYA